MINNYYPIESSATPLLFIYFGIMVSSLVMSILLIRKPHFKNNFIMHCLVIVYLLIMFSTSMLFLGLLDAWISGFKQELYLISIQIAYISLNIVNVFIVLFSKDIFKPYYRCYKLLIAGCIIIAFLKTLPQNAYGIPVQDVPSSHLYFRFITTTVMMTWSIIIYVRNTMSGRQMANTFRKGELRFKITIISNSFILMALFVIFLSVETTLFVFVELPAYTFLIYLAWMMIFFFILTSYLGYIMPKWFKKIFLKNNPLP